MSNRSWCDDDGESARALPDPDDPAGTGPSEAAKDFVETGTTVLRSLGRYLDESRDGRHDVVRLRHMSDIAADLNARELIRSGGLGDQCVSWLDTYLSTTTRLHHPGSMAHQVAVPAPMSALGELVQGLTNNPMAMFEMGPGAATLEMVVIEWMLERAGWNAPRWPGDTSAPGSCSAGVLTHGGSLANLTALLAARAAAAPEAWDKGGTADLAVVVPPSSHYSMARAVSIMGLGARAVVPAPVDRLERIVPDRLPEVCAAIRDRGRRVMAVVANACATGTGLYDPLDEVTRFCQEAGHWCHVDGAHGASALVSRQHRDRLRGLERANSMVWDAHKMLRAPSLCAAVLLRDERWFDAAFQESASYLFYGEQREGFDFIHRTVECTKAALGLRAFVSLALEGERAIADYYDGRCALATRAAALIRDRPGFEVPYEPSSNIVCFRWIAADDDGQIAIRDALLRGGSHHLSSAEIAGRRYLRLALMNPETTDATIACLLDRIERLASSTGAR
jgi:L-2,4-diaminobutyrate decarboxylase